jgi:hypothetical protein
MSISVGRKNDFSYDIQGYKLQDFVVKQDSVVNVELKEAKKASESIISEKFAEYMQAANEHNVDKHLSFYEKNPNLNFVYNNKVIKGWQNLYDNQEIWWSNGNDIQYTYEAEFRALHPDSVLAFVKFGFTKTVNNQLVSGNWDFKCLWQNLPEGWRIVDATEGSPEK